MEIMPVAVSLQPSVAWLFGARTRAYLIRGCNGAPDTSTVLVPANTLDNILGSRFSSERCLIMIDVEGHEKAVIAGAQALLAQVPKAIWFVEIGLAELLGGRPGNPAFSRVFKGFFAAGYDAWACTSSPWRISVEDVRSAASSSTSLGTHSFLFVEKGLDLSATDDARGLTNAHRPPLQLTSLRRPS